VLIQPPIPLIKIDAVCYPPQSLITGPAKMVPKLSLYLFAQLTRQAPFLGSSKYVAEHCEGSLEVVIAAHIIVPALVILVVHVSFPFLNGVQGSFAWCQSLRGCAQAIPDEAGMSASRTPSFITARLPLR
jgi:hypothetical protein